MGVTEDIRKNEVRCVASQAGNASWGRRPASLSRRGVEAPVSASYGQSVARAARTPQSWRPGRVASGAFRLP